MTAAKAIARRVVVATAPLLGAPFVSRAQESRRVFRVAHLALTQRSEQLTREQVLPVLADAGFVVGRNLVFEGRHGDVAALPDLAREIVAGRPDVVVAIGAHPVRAMAHATRSVPIVMFADDPVAAGVAASLARPGGNVTGIANLVVDLQAKRLGLLLEALPAVRRIGALLRASSPTRAALERELGVATTRAGIGLAIAYADGAADYAPAFAALRAAAVEAIVIGPDPQFYADAARIVDLATAARLAASCEWPDMARIGCLIGYGADQIALRRRLALYVERILRGADPAEMPIEQPTVLELTINLRTATTLGLTLPAALLLRADEVIE